MSSTQLQDTGEHKLPDFAELAATLRRDAGRVTSQEVLKLIDQWWWRYSSILIPSRRNTIPKL
jgi:hypothetical protein